MRIALAQYRARPGLGSVAGLALLAAVVAVAGPISSDLSLAAPALLLVMPVVVAAAVGGRNVGIAVALAAAGVFDVVFIPPRWTFEIHAVDDLMAFGVFVVVAIVIGTFVALEGERRQSAEERADELHTLNTQLQDVQRERARLEEEATRAAVLERVDEQRAALLRSVSHDLRTPLATIRAVVSDLLGGAPYDDSTRAELLALVAQEAERLDRLVANLLSLSRIEAGALRPERQAVEIDELVAHTVKRLDRLFGGKRVQLDVTRDLPLVDGDYTQLEQVVSNLLENAARHAPPRSTITVGGRSSGDHVEMWVDDEGPGIAPFERARIFEPFRRGEGSTSSGIGLAICKAIVEAHGGHIAAEGAPAGGARLRFTLPRHHDRR